MTCPQPSIEVIPGVDPQLTSGLPVVIGVPLTQGSVPNPSQLALADATGAPVPFAARTLVNWPDGSVRWALACLLARRPGVHHVSIDDAATAKASSKHPVQVMQDNDSVTIGNDLIHITLGATGAGPIR